MKSSRLVNIGLSVRQLSDLLMTHNFDDMKMNGEKSSFSRITSMIFYTDWKELSKLWVNSQQDI